MEKNSKNKLPHKEAQRTSELNLFLYFLISGVSETASCEVGVTFTLMLDSRRGGMALLGPPARSPAAGPVPLAPKPNVRNERCFCCR